MWLCRTISNRNYETQHYEHDKSQNRGCGHCRRKVERPRHGQGNYDTQRTQRGLEKKLRPDMQLLIVEGATHGRPGDQQQHSSMVVEAYAVVTRITSMAFNPRLDFQDYNRAGDLL